MDSLFLCPVCGKALDRQETGYRCPGGHSFDKAAAGYVHLLPANKKHAKDPGDDKGMAAARNRFLSGGWYAPLRDRLAELALRYTPDRCVVLDAGCGEGYYTAGVYAALKKAGKQVKLAGVDLSKHALKKAAKREKDGEFAVASVYGLPVADRCVHLLLNCFSPLALEEFPKYPELYTAPCLPDIIVLPGETEVEVCGVTFGLVRTPGHTVDHVCIRTPDNVLYLGDAMMTGRTLHRSKFPYAFDVGVYLDSLGKLRMAEADKFIVAHQGVYDEILPFIDLELRFMTTRMLELLDLVPPDGFTTPKLMTQAMCQKYRIHSDSVRTMAYYESAGGIYIHYLVGQGYLESYVEEDQIRYRLTQLARDRDKPKGEALPKAGLFGALPGESKVSE